MMRWMQPRLTFISAVTGRSATDVDLSASAAVYKRVLTWMSPVKRTALVLGWVYMAPKAISYSEDGGFVHLYGDDPRNLISICGDFTRL